MGDMAKLFLLTGWDTESPMFLAVYADEVKAREEAQRLEGAYTQTKPAWDDWCKRRWAIVEEMRRGPGERINKFGIPDDGGEQDIIEQIGRCPKLDGYENCEVDTVEDRTKI